MPKVKSAVTKDVPKIDFSATVLDACKLMNAKNSTGVVVFRGEKPVGMFTERSLLRKFVLLNKKAEEVQVGTVMAPMLYIEADASTKKAAKTMVDNGRTRLGVKKDGDFLGWITLTDVARQTSRGGLLRALDQHSRLQDDIVCPSCRGGYLHSVSDESGRILRWQCDKCGYSE
jgi:CBS domain-containing protein/ribosomal protein S27AE